MLALIIAAAAAITVFGYLGDKDEKVNTVKIGEDKASITETFSEPDKQTVSDTFTKSVQVKNTGSADCFVRVFLELSDSRLADGKVKLSADGTSFVTWEQFKASPPEDWEFVSCEDNALDGNFYYKKTVAPGSSTPPLISKIKTAYDSVYDISDFEIIVYSETVQTVETDTSGTVYAASDWKTAWSSFLKV